jgi:hypothetical protein
MSEPTKKRLWLDGGYDRDEVEACVYHPAHKWIVLRMGDVHPHPHDPEELMVICRSCFVPRCGHTTDTNPCMLPRHHPERHLAADGSQEPADQWPGSEKPAPPDILARYGLPTDSTVLERGVQDG